MLPIIKLDGNWGEGGGSIVRVALALSTITGEPFEIDSIRKGRATPGLKNQHLYCIRALEKLCNAESEGAELGSTCLKYRPGKIKGQTLSIDIKTAGSISLLLQSLILPSVFADSTVRLKIIGGTCGKWAMPFDYLNNVFLPHIRKYADIEAKLQGRGYYPKGGGKVDLRIKPKFNLENINQAPKIGLTEQGSLIQIKGISHASSDLQKASVAERQARAAKLALSQFNCPVNIQAEYSNALSIGSGITLWAVCSKDPGEIDFNNPIIIGADALGERGKKAEVVGREAAENLAKEINSKAPVDLHLADNLIQFLAVMGGKIKVSKITRHTLTNIYDCEKFFGKIFSVDEENKVISSVKGC